MSGLSNSFDYQVKLLGLLPLNFDFSNVESTGVRFETVKLKKVKKPSEDVHDGQVIVSDAQILYSTAIAETKIIRQKTTTTSTSNQQNVHEVNPTDSKVKVNDDDQVTALIGGVWKLEEDPENYTCKHLAETRTVKEETLRETRSTRHYSADQQFFYKRVRMQSNFWQCYLAGESNYLVGVNGPIYNDSNTEEKREIKELRLYDVAAIPGFIKKCGVEQGFLPWSKDILENRLYKSLCVIYDKVIDAPVGTDFMFVKYNEFDPPVHDVDGSITSPYLLAFRQLKIEGLSTPSQVINLVKSSKYEEFMKGFGRKRFAGDNVPKVEQKENCLILTFENETLAKMFHMIVNSYLNYLRKNKNFPPEFENLNITKVFMSKPVAPGGSNTQSWRSSNNQNQWNNDERKEVSGGNNAQSWRNSNYQESNARNNNDSWRRTDSADNNSQSWRSSNQHRQQYTPGSGTQSWRNSNYRQQQQQPNDRNTEDGARQHYNRQMYHPSNKGDKGNWRQN